MKWLLLVAPLALACHAQQKFPAPAQGRTATAEIELFEQAPSGLDDKPSLTDLSFLNDEAAGAHGFVRAELGHFVDDRGARLRFFGVNLSGSACLPDRPTADRLARHLRKLGFNAVRLHALDAPGALLTQAGTLAPEALERLDHFTAALKAAGLYFSLGLHARSGYPGLEGEALARFPQGKVLDRFHAPFWEAQRAGAKQLLTHVNPETHLAYVAEPALLYVELSNEDTLFPSWAGSPDDLPELYRRELAQGYGAWLAARTADGLRAPGPADEEAKGELPTFHGSPGARADYAQYLLATERAGVAGLAAFVRRELGLRSMLINTQASFGGVPGVLREAETSDFIDVHGYWDAPRAAGDDPATGQHWALGNTPQIGAPDAGTLGVMASYRVFGKPFTVSEYASAAPNDYAAEMFPLLIGIAGLQDWDALFAFTYADQKPDYEPSRINGVFDIAGHPAKLAFVTTAARAFRRGLVAPGRSRVELDLPEQPSALPFAENALPNLWRDSGVPTSVAAIRQLGITLHPGSGDVHASYALHVTGALGSDTGEILWDPAGQHPRFSIDAPALKLVCGMLANTQLKFAGAGFEFHDYDPGFACASLISLDDQPIERARRLLLTVVGRAQNAHRPRASQPNQIGPLGAGPALVQYVPITVSLPRDAWQVSALDATGTPVRALPVVNGADSRVSTTLAGAAVSYAITR